MIRYSFTKADSNAGFRFAASQVVSTRFYSKPNMSRCSVCACEVDSSPANCRTSGGRCAPQQSKGLEASRCKAKLWAKRKYKKTVFVLEPFLLQTCNWSSSILSWIAHELSLVNSSVGRCRNRCLKIPPGVM